MSLFGPNLTPRKSYAVHKVTQWEFIERYKKQFSDPTFQSMAEEIEKLAQQAWKNHQDGRKAPHTQKAGLGFEDENYQLSLDWVSARNAILAAEDEHINPQGPTRILLISGSDRNEETCPGEVSKSMRLISIARDYLSGEKNVEFEVLDLSRITAEYGKNIYPCKGCVSTAMPLCHWPCSCYPNHSLGHVSDWMNEIYPMWVRAHGVMIITPVYWHQAPAGLKLMIDRLVCADGGNPDPTSTQGKDAEKAKKMELNNWEYPRHLKGRVFSVIVHGDATGVDQLKNALSDWLEEMELIPVTNFGNFARYIGYFGPYATSHEALDQDPNMMDDTLNAIKALLGASLSSRHHLLDSLNPILVDPRPK